MIRIISRGSEQVTTRALLIVTASLELGAGVALLAMPSLAVSLLLGEELTSPQALVVARVTGAAVIALGTACWVGRNADRGSQTSIVVGMLIYNSLVPVILVHGFVAWSLGGLALWPACVVHAAMGIWCAACIKR